MLAIQNGSNRTESVMQNYLVRAAHPLHRHLALVQCLLSTIIASKMMVICAVNLCHDTVQWNLRHICDCRISVTQLAFVCL